MTISGLGAGLSVAKTAQASCNYTSQNIPYAWSRDGYDQKAFPVDQYMCVLGALQGSWSGTGNGGNMQGGEVTLENDGYWHVVTYQSGDYAYAYCVPASCFSGANSNYVVEWDNVDYPSDFHSESSISDTCGNLGCDHESNNNGYPGLPGTQSSLTMLAGWPLSTGATNGSGENAGVTNNPGSPNTLFSQTCVANEDCWGEVLAEFTSIFVGTVNTSIPVYPYVTGWTTGTYTLDMGTNGSQGICYMTYVQGAFRGSPGSVALIGLSTTGEWTGATSQGQGSELGANYACMGYFIDH